MKKLIISISIIVVLLSLNKQEKVIMPKEAIRFRVIANSNTEHDQAIKKELVTNLNKEFSAINLTPKNIENYRSKLRNSLPRFEEIVKTTLQDEKNQEYQISYGMNYFPQKEYKGIKYEEGEYESLVITLGNGLGDNFWCILFPPLCLLEGEETEKDEVEYTSFIKELIEKYL